MDNIQLHPLYDNTYTDIRGRTWQYWPLSETDQMWCEVTCNQFNCLHPVTFIGMVNIHGDGVLYYDSAAAWCYWCMPREAMTEEGQRMARHAEWARRQTIDECIEMVNDLWSGASDGETIDSFTTRLIWELRYRKQAREEQLAPSLRPPEFHVGRVHMPDMRYAVRPNSPDGVGFIMAGARNRP